MSTTNTTKATPHFYWHKLSYTKSSFQSQGCYVLSETVAVVDVSHDRQRQLEEENTDVGSLNFEEFLAKTTNACAFGKRYLISSKKCPSFTIAHSNLCQR